MRVGYVKKKDQQPERLNVTEVRGVVTVSVTERKIFIEVIQSVNVFQMTDVV